MFEFGPFRLDAVSWRLLRDGKSVHLTSKSFDALLLLIRRSGEVVDRDELLKTIWPRNDVDDASLTVAISVLRKALGESSQSHNYIETVARRGYRFTGRVRELTPEESARVQNRKGRLIHQKGSVESVAVLPLINESKSPDSDYLCDGITESIIDSLSQLRLASSYSLDLRCDGKSGQSLRMARKGIRAPILLTPVFKSSASFRPAQVRPTICGIGESRGFEVKAFAHHLIFLNEINVIRRIIHVFPYKA